MKQKDCYVRVKLSDIVKLKNENMMLRQKLEVYEPSEKRITLLDECGNPVDKDTHPLFKPGPKSLLESLPDTFSEERALSNGVKKSMLSKWKFRHYITLDSNGIYHKTDKYQQRIRQSKLRIATDMDYIKTQNRYDKGTVT